MERHAVANYPEECCGVILGRPIPDEPGAFLVERILPDDVKRQRPLGRSQDPDVRPGDPPGPSSRDLAGTSPLTAAVNASAPEYAADFAASPSPPLH